MHQNSYQNSTNYWNCQSYSRHQILIKYSKMIQRAISPILTKHWVKMPYFTHVTDNIARVFNQFCINFLSKIKNHSTIVVLPYCPWINPGMQESRFKLDLGICFTRPNSRHLAYTLFSFLTYHSGVNQHMYWPLSLL